MHLSIRLSKYNVMQNNGFKKAQLSLTMLVVNDSQTIFEVNFLTFQLATK